VLNGCALCSDGWCGQTEHYFAELSLLEMQLRCDRRAVICSAVDLGGSRCRVGEESEHDQSRSKPVAAICPAGFAVGAHDARSAISRKVYTRNLHARRCRKLSAWLPAMLSLRFLEH